MSLPDLLELYVKEIEKMPKLSDKEIKEMFRKYKKGDKSMKYKILRANLRLVIPIAQKYAAGSSVSILDIIEEGNLGLMKAIEKYNPNKGVKLSTYATYWIEQYIKRAIERIARVVKIPSHMWETMKKWTRLWEEFYSKFGRYPKISEMAKVLNLSQRQIKNLITTIEMTKSGTTSLEKPIDENSETLPLDVIPDKTIPAPDDFMSKILFAQHMKSLLSKLSQRERKIINYRYGLYDGERYTLEKVGKILKLSRERVRQLERRAINKLKWMAHKEGIIRL